MNRLLLLLGILGYLPSAFGFSVTTNRDLVAGRATFVAGGSPVAEFDWASFFAPGAHQRGFYRPSIQSSSLSVRLPDGTVHTVRSAPEPGVGTLHLANWVDAPGFDGPNGSAAAELAVDGVESFQLIFGTELRSVGFGVITGVSNVPNDVDLRGAEFLIRAYDGAGVPLGSFTLQLAAGAIDQAWLTVTSDVPFRKLEVLEIGNRSIQDQYFTNMLTSVENVSACPQVTEPTLVLQGSSAMTLECGVDSWVDPGARAWDVGCAPLEVHRYNSGSDPYGPGPNTSAEGTYSVQYIAWNAAGTTVSAIRSVRVDDRTPPSLKLKGPASVTHTCGAPWVDPGVEAVDACYGDVSPTVRRLGDVNGWAEGTYAVRYEVTDSGGNSAPALTRVVEVVDCPW
jgi:hypothetical protein